MPILFLIIKEKIIHKRMKKRKWNLGRTVKIVRSQGKIIGGEDAKKGSAGVRGRPPASARNL